MLVLPSVYQWSPSYAFNFNSSEYFVTTITVFKSSDDISNYRLNDQSIPPTDTVDIAGIVLFFILATLYWIYGMYERRDAIYVQNIPFLIPFFVFSRLFSSSKGKNA